MKTLFLFVLVWAAGVYVFEFRVLHRPTFSAVASAAAAQPAPVFGLVNASFACAATGSAATSLQVTGEAATATCEPSLTEPTTRCASGFPMMGYGDQIKCATGEAVHCAGGPLQTVGLFKDDSFCGDVSDRDLGPPQEAPRVDD